MTETAASSVSQAGGRRLARKVVLTFVGALGFAAALTLLFYGMRSVMDIGGSCASGNTPFEIARPCPDGVAGVMVGGIFGGLFFLAVYALNVVGPNLTLLAWPALFLSLGWNFLEYGVNPPGDDGGLVWGWLICGVVFVAMGGIPLLIGLRAARATRATRRAAESPGALPDAARTAARRTRLAAWALQLAALGLGIWVGIELFEAATGTTVTFG
ncbi:MAG: hypothetical protein R6X23_09110 [Acidimicrobiia bacterium]